MTTLLPTVAWRLLALVPGVLPALAAGLLATPALAAPPPSGTIACSVVGGDTLHGHGLVFRPYIATDPRRVLVKATNSDSTCDNSGVTGGKAPIVAVALKFIARMPEGTCAQLTSSPVFVNGTVKLKWRGLNPANRLMTVAVSKADIATASFDGGSDALILTTQPITVGAFVGGIATLHLGLDDVAGFTARCSTNAVAGQSFGQVNPSTVEVQ